MDYRGMTALITGASAGLGEAFAQQLSGKGATLILTARSADKLIDLAALLRERDHADVTVIPADLSQAKAVDALVAEVVSRGLKVDLLINNAGVGVFRDFLDSSFAEGIGEVDLNVRAIVALTYAFLPGMVAARRGGIINLASTAAFQPLAGASVYAASKAFVLLFSEGLSLEVERTGVTVTAACPGPVATNFFAKMNPRLQAGQMDQPGAVVNDILKGLERGKRVVYPGRMTNRLSTLGARFLPRNLILRLAVGVTKKLNQK
jgi:short-subunit dehydrogenase